MFRDNKAFSGFAVNDVPAAKKFYEETLGLEVTEENGLLQLTIGNNGKVLVYPKPNHEPATFTVLNFPVGNIDEAVDELAGRGVRFIHYDFEGLRTDEKGVFREAGPNIAWFNDPAGNIFSVIETD